MFNFNTSKKGGDPLTPPREMRSSATENVNAQNNCVNTNSLEEQALIKAKIQEIEGQRLEFLKKNPNFDMDKEMENRDFVDYVWRKGLTVEDGYFLAHKDEIIAHEAEEAIRRYLARNDRISENGATKSSAAVVKKNPKEMSDTEIDSIIERVRNGEKVSF